MIDEGKKATGNSPIIFRARRIRRPKSWLLVFFLVCYDYLNNKTADTELSKWKTIEREKKRWHSCKYKTRKTTENEQEKMSFNNAVTEDGQKTRRKNH